jgi:hypothetical protein
MFSALRDPFSKEILYVPVRGEVKRTPQAKRRQNIMITKKIALVVGGVALAALGVVGALKYSTATQTGAAQGAIGQRSVYRDNPTTKDDVAVVPGSAPVAEGANGSGLKGVASPADVPAMQSEMKVQEGFRGRAPQAMQSEMKVQEGFRGRAPQAMQSEMKVQEGFRGRAPQAMQSEMKVQEGFRGRAPQAMQSEAKIQDGIRGRVSQTAKVSPQ